MIEEIGTTPMEVALLAAFTFTLGAFALILWDLLRGRRRGRLRVMAMVVGVTACALAATVLSAGVGWAVAVTLEPDKQAPPAHTEQTTPENQQRTSPRRR
jgi:thiol:disulfide interchange protein